MRVHAIQHVGFEGVGHIGQWVASRGHRLSLTRLDMGEPLPAQAAYDRLAVMGGPMNIYEDGSFPWLAAERQFIKDAMQSGKTVVGICLGAQLLADALGSPVVAGPHKEIGWFPVRLTEAGQQSPLLAGLPAEINVFHWHGDTFRIPPDSVHLAASEACESQAFLHHDRILGLQFHLESTPETVHQLLAHCSDELIEGPYTQDAARIEAQPAASFAAINRLLETLLDRLP